MGRSGAWGTARSEVFLVLPTLAANLHGDEDDDHVDDHANAAEGGDQADVLGYGRAGEREHRGEPSNGSGASVSSLPQPAGAVSGPDSARRGAGAVERARLEIA